MAPNIASPHATALLPSFLSQLRAQETELDNKLCAVATAHLDNLHCIFSHIGACDTPLDLETTRASREVCTCGVDQACWHGRLAPTASSVAHSLTVARRAASSQPHVMHRAGVAFSPLSPGHLSTTSAASAPPAPLEP
jgi:hypothetical protein